MELGSVLKLSHVLLVFYFYLFVSLGFGYMPDYVKQIKKIIKNTHVDGLLLVIVKEDYYNMERRFCFCFLVTFTARKVKLYISLTL